MHPEPIFVQKYETKFVGPSATSKLTLSVELTTWYQCWNSFYLEKVSLLFGTC